jgi:hypothetical protein
MFPIVQLIRKEMKGEFTQDEGERIIKHLVMFMKPKDVSEFLYTLKNSVSNISEVLLTSILNFQLNSIEVIERNEPSIDERIDGQLTIKELCSLMKISRPTFNKWRVQGLRVSNIGKRVFVSQSDLNEFIKNHKK